MDTLRAMEVIVAIAEHGGFSAAGRQLGLSAPAITRIVSELEIGLNVKLVLRTTRSVRMTEAGDRYVQDARRILAAVDDASDAVRGIHGELRGRVNVTASILFGRLFVSDLLVDFLRRHPGIEIATLYVDRVVQLAEENQDIAIRIGHLADSSLRAIRVGTVRRIVCGAPDYLDLRGAPKCPEDLDSHEIIGITALGAGLNWQLGRDGAVVMKRVRPRLFVNSHESGIAAAEAGFGLTQACSDQIAHQLRAGTLKAVLTEFEPPALPVQLLHREGDRTSARVRALVDHLAAGLREQLEMLSQSEPTASAAG
ncbi:MAG: LysR family transcriptional regulator [Sphingobium sp.]|jgi:DNA-binding transcriptional LysR family regulator|nr:LysR family transcriptional regulator [Sphingobium sp.]